MWKRICAAAALAVGVAALAARGQNLISESPAHSLPGSQAVQYIFPEQVNVTAGRPTEVALHFRVARGLHINSHSPREDYLIPTTLSLPANSGARLESASYPAGEDYVLPLDPKTKLNVYTGDFTIRTRIVGTRGNHLVQAKLHFQACDQRECMPPNTITAAVDIVAK